MELRPRIALGSAVFHFLAAGLSAAALLRARFAAPSDAAGGRGIANEDDLPLRFAFMISQVAMGFAWSCIWMRHITWGHLERWSLLTASVMCAAILWISPSGGMEPSKEGATVVEAGAMVTAFALLVPVRLSRWPAVPLSALVSYAMAAGVSPAASGRDLDVVVTRAVALALLVFVPAGRLRRQEWQERVVWLRARDAKADGSGILGDRYAEVRRAWDVAVERYDLTFRLTEQCAFRQTSRAIHDAFFGRRVEGAAFAGFLVREDRARFKEVMDLVSASKELGTLSCTLNLPQGAVQVELAAREETAARPVDSDDEGEASSFVVGLRIMQEEALPAAMAGEEAATFTGVVPHSLSERPSPVPMSWSPIRSAEVGHSGDATERAALPRSDFGTPPQGVLVSLLADSEALQHSSSGDAVERPSLRTPRYSRSDFGTPPQGVPLPLLGDLEASNLNQSGDSGERPVPWVPRDRSDLSTPPQLQVPGMANFEAPDLPSTPSHRSGSDGAASPGGMGSSPSGHLDRASSRSARSNRSTPGRQGRRGVSVTSLLSDRSWLAGVAQDQLWFSASSEGRQTNESRPDEDRLSRQSSSGGGRLAAAGSFARRIVQRQQVTQAVGTQTDRTPPKFVDAGVNTAIVMDGMSFRCMNCSKPPKQPQYYDPEGCAPVVPGPEALALIAKLDRQKRVNRNVPAQPPQVSDLHVYTGSEFNGRWEVIIPDGGGAPNEWLQRFLIYNGKVLLGDGTWTVLAQVGHGPVLLKGGEVQVRRRRLRRLGQSGVELEFYLSGIFEEAPWD